MTGVPVLFLPGNAGSYAQVRSLASETARQLQRAREKSARHAASCADAEQATAAAGDPGGDALVGSGQSGDAARCARQQAMSEKGVEGNHTDLAWYAADFNEELSAFDGKLLVRPH